MFKHKDNKIANICLQVKIYIWLLRIEPWLARWQAPYFMPKGNLQYSNRNDIKLTYIELIRNKVRIKLSLICLMEILSSSIK